MNNVFESGYEAPEIQMLQVKAEAGFAYSVVPTWYDNEFDLDNPQ